MVYINDSSLFTSPAHDFNPIVPRGSRDPDVQLRLFFDGLDPMLGIQLANMDSGNMDVRLTGYTAFFGADLSAHFGEPPEKLPRIMRGEGLPLFRDRDNQKGCSPYKHAYPDSILIVKRGDCNFLDKLVQARDAGAAGVIVISNEDLAINPTANADEVEAAGNLDDVGLLLVPKSPGGVLLELMETMENLSEGQVMVVIHRDPLATPDSTRRGPARKEQRGKTEKGQDKENVTKGDEKDQDANNPRILYINGHPLLNTRMWV